MMEHRGRTIFTFASRFSVTIAHSTAVYKQVYIIQGDRFAVAAASTTAAALYPFPRPISGHLRRSTDCSKKFARIKRPVWDSTNTLLYSTVNVLPGKVKIVELPRQLHLLRRHHLGLGIITICLVLLAAYRFVNRRLQILCHGHPSRNRVIVGEKVGVPTIVYYL